MAKEKELKDQRIPIMMSETELSAIDDWSFKNRIRSRGEAIRRLCQIGLVFDDHRAEFVTKFRAVFEAASDVIALFQRAANDPHDLTDFEHSLIDSALNTLEEVNRMAALVRTTTGLANNLKGDRELEEIVAEAKEIIAVRANKNLVVRKLDHVLNDIAREVARAMEDDGISATEKPAIQNRIAEAQRQLDRLNAKILGSG